MWGVGGGQSSDGTSNGFRTNLNVDAGLALDDGNGRFLRPTGTGWLFTGSLATGFRAYPTYAGLEVGRFAGADTVKYVPVFGYAGASWALGPAARLLPSVAWGVHGRATATFIAPQIGVDVNAIFTPVTDVQVCFVIGFGVD
jgi:hypothetical protein